MATFFKDGPGYQNLKAEGLTAGSVSPVMSQRAVYRLEFEIIKPMARKDAKRLAIAFLEREFEAYNFEFFAKRGKEDTVFIAEFVSFAC
jgi:hypothetical protein